MGDKDLRRERVPRVDQTLQFGLGGGGAMPQFGLGGAMPPAMVSRGYRNAVGVATLAYFTDAKIK